MRPYENELTLDEVTRVIDSIASAYTPIMILTGGEPMLRDDLEAIVRHCKTAGLRPVLATCGALLTPESARALREWGIERISVSIDGPDAESHDAFRGMPGAFTSALNGLAAAREAGLEFQINTTVTRHNADRLDDILTLAVEQGAVAFHPFLLVPTGRGDALREQALDAEEYEQVLHHIYDMREAAKIHFKPTCAPHYYRVLRQREAAAGRKVTPDTHGLDAMSRGCMGGTGFAFISHTGTLQICGFLEKEAGDLREAGYDFPKLWRESPLFNELRDFKNYEGDCGVCEYRAWCGGCRARAYPMPGNYLAADRFCTYTPTRRRGGA